MIDFEAGNNNIFESIQVLFATATHRFFLNYIKMQTYHSIDISINDFGTLTFQETKDMNHKIILLPVEFVFIR